METINDIVREMRSGKLSATVECENCGSEYEQRFSFDTLADRIEAAIEAYNQEVVELLKSVIDGVCLHCDMQSACQEGEDGMSTTCNAVAKANHFIEQHTEPELNNDECPF